MSDEDFTRDPLPLERDSQTVDFFASAGDPPRPEPSKAYTVLARQYRPRTFEDLIGQEGMVRTLTNAFATGRIAHGFMLTGVRGVGKTTTARLLARALNYESETVRLPSMALSVEGRHCRAIMEGRHIDVLELDAASHNGVAEMRDLLDGVRYAPVEARYRVFVLDEVHMLSTPAFNALLKTLEEPPPHAKFIFATTEIRKVPVTILSRCQRFDLRRVEVDTLAEHLSRICKAESAMVEAEGLTLIARAAEGSVRDALSLLDQALVQVDRGQLVSGALVRDMLGLADRAATLDLFDLIIRGEAAAAVDAATALWALGADPAILVSDLLEHCHGAAMSRTLGPDNLGLPRDQAARLTSIGVHLSMGTLSRLWQMLLKAHDEVRRAPQPKAALDMALIRFCYAADLPGPEAVLSTVREGHGTSLPIAGGPGPQRGGGGTQARLAPAQPMAVTLPKPESFEQVLALITEQRDIGLKLDVERYLRLVAFRPGAITFEPASGAPANLAPRLVTRLKAWTGQPWLVATKGGGGGESLLERERREHRTLLGEVEADPLVRALLDGFPGTEIIEVRQLAAPMPELRPNDLDGHDAD